MPARRASWLLPLGVALLTAATLAPAVVNGFTNWDDPAYVLNNHRIRDLSAQGLRVIATSFVEGNYHPLTILSLAIDYQLHGLDPAGYHATNVALHVLNTLAVYGLILLLAGSRSIAAMTAAFFGVHPLHVESVAWISARKDLLYALFLFGSLIAYIRWIRGGRRRTAAYAVSLALFVLSLLSKGMAVVLPLTLLVTDFYLRRSWNVRTQIVEKAPFAALAVLFGVLAVVAQASQGAIQTVPHVPLVPDRLLIASHALSTYLVRAVAPLGLSAFDPYPVKSAGIYPVEYYLAPAFLALVAFAVWKSLRLGREVTWGALVFVIHLLPVLQLVPVGSAAMADRYTYVAYVGLGFVGAWGARALVRRAAARGSVQRAAATAALTLFGGCLIVATILRIGVWKDSVRLWSDVIAKHPALPMAYTHRAWAYQEQGAGDQARADLSRALALEPNDAEALITRGTIEFLAGEFREARIDLDRAVRLRPGSEEARNARGTVLLALEQYDAAIADFSQAVTLRPDFAEGYLNRGLAFAARGRYQEALPDFDRAIRFGRASPQAHVWRGVARREVGNVAGALQDFEEALRLDPAFGEAYRARSQSHEAAGRYHEALRDALRARQEGAPVEDATIARLRTATLPSPPPVGSSKRGPRSGSPG